MIIEQKNIVDKKLIVERKMIIEQKLIERNFNSGRVGNKIAAIELHHTAANVSLERLYEEFNRQGKNASAHYGIRDNRIMQFIKDTDTAWQNGNSKDSRFGNFNLLGVEVTNSKLAPNWEVSDKSLDTLIEFLYTKAKEHNLFPLVRKINIFGHFELHPTLCPGPHLTSKIDEIIKIVNSL